MTYADFPYYQDFFKGSLIKSEDAFRTFAERASEFLDTVTFDRLADAEKLNRHEKNVKKCVCALTEQFFRRAELLKLSENSPKTAESIGQYSVTYANPTEFARGIFPSESDFVKSLKQTALHYLGNTGLMYRGVE